MIQSLIFCLFRSGMRGVIDVTVSVGGGTEPYGHHSGVHGGAIAEPMLVNGV